jgi:hypothetical protein
MVDKEIGLLKGVTEYVDVDLAVYTCSEKRDNRYHSGEKKAHDMYLLVELCAVCTVSIDNKRLAVADLNLTLQDRVEYDIKWSIVSSAFISFLDTTVYEAPGDSSTTLSHSAFLLTHYYMRVGIYEMIYIITRRSPLRVWSRSPCLCTDSRPSP